MKNLVKRFRNRVSKYLRGHFDEIVLMERYRHVFGREMDIFHPKTFNEKINFLNLYNRKSHLSKLVDKYEVRNYVQSKGLEAILNDVYGVYDRVEDVPFQSLPTSFALKCTHGSNWNLLCADKDKLNWEKERHQIQNWLNSNYYSFKNEWIYKNIRPRIIVERYLGENLVDYKIFCFNGQPKMIQVDKDRFIDHTRRFFDLDWNDLQFKYGMNEFIGQIPRPELLTEMISIAATLSKNLVFSRIDLFYIAGKIFFSEITFFPGAGNKQFTPEEYDLEVGNWLDISSVKIPLTNRLILKIYQSWKQRKVAKEQIQNSVIE